ncbi:MAG: 16S rRNA (cytidine(1402)-2'-O)-methyltransferase [Candidatus Nealsonbacteria bacterium]|nr:16S rRNA (cytidine(1402)-2'-O)-methyltransferase [Candidatus Nealsonbacteria bacterium]
MGIFYIVATPIGNLEDITLRAIRILKEVGLVLCEDTRVTKFLLERLNIKAQLLSYHQHSQQDKISYILENLKEKNIALVTDSGTPGISDPGNKLIEEALKKFKDEIKIIPIPGPSALTALASVSGFPMDKFLFLGFPPTKNKRKKFFDRVVSSEVSVIFYESSYRILKSLGELEGLNQNLKIVVGRELTKKFETIYRGEIREVIEKIKKDPIKGEFVVITKND